ncbi:hypothetical protein ANN_22633 [Periplaneta americana]|uniref:Uncharacterized protein n=1 Tax=Periplaneta americana TaxID=6978 RepID=A0ABQ8S9L3_PERAM|nr:hypothetical protein ANN_22633 [Periplaneta americana]
MSRQVNRAERRYVLNTRLFSVDEIGDSEMRPRIRHILPCIHIAVRENQVISPTGDRTRARTQLQTERRQSTVKNSRSYRSDVTTPLWRAATGVYTWIKRYHVKLETWVLVPVPERIFLRSTDSSPYGNTELQHRNSIYTSVHHSNIVTFPIGRSRVTTGPENVQATTWILASTVVVVCLHVKTANTEHTTCTDVSHLSFCMLRYKGKDDGSDSRGIRGFFPFILFFLQHNGSGFTQLLTECFLGAITHGIDEPPKVVKILGDVLPGVKNMFPELVTIPRWVFGLSFLPPNEVGDAFVEDLVSNQPVNESITGFADYLVSNFIKPDSLFSTEIWTSDTVASDRTNDACKNMPKQDTDYVIAC